MMDSDLAPTDSEGLMGCPLCNQRGFDVCSLFRHVERVHPKVAQKVSWSFSQIKSMPKASYWYLAELKRITNRKGSKQKTKMERYLDNLPSAEPIELVSQSSVLEREIGAAFSKVNPDKIEGHPIRGGLPSLGKRSK